MLPSSLLEAYTDDLSSIYDFKQLAEFVKTQVL